MNILDPIRSCLDDIIERAGNGMKVMILDDITTSVVSVACPRSEMLLKEVYVFQRLDDIKLIEEDIKFLKCLVILQPTKENINHLCQELKRPHYRTYYIYFTGRILPELVEKLAKSDECEVVRDIKEYPIDYIAISPHIFTLNMLNGCYDPTGHKWRNSDIETQISESLFALLMSIRMNPVIRYQDNSTLCRLLANRVHIKLKKEQVLNPDFNQTNPYEPNSMLLILDRRIDTPTAVINKWTYQAMVHEQLHLMNNRVNLSNIPNRKPNDPKELILSTLQDEFFGKNRNLNYGEIGVTLKASIDNLKSRTESQQKVETMGDMRRFIEEYPETRRMSSNVHNHVLVLGELSRIVTTFNLVSVSENEQEILCGTSSNSELLKKLRQLVPSTTIRPLDAMRLVVLYAISGRNDASGSDSLQRLFKARQDVSESQVDAIKYLREFAPHRNDYNGRNKIDVFTRKIAKGVRGIDNVFTQYRPVLQKILDDIAQSRLRDDQFPNHSGTQVQNSTRRLVIFFIGGMTFEESLCVDRLNQSSNSRMRGIIGGTAIHNFESFVDEVIKSKLGDSK